MLRSAYVYVLGGADQYVHTKQGYQGHIRRIEWYFRLLLKQSNGLRMRREMFQDRVYMLSCDL